MKRKLLAAILAIGISTGAAFATKYLKKPITGGTDNALLKMGPDVDTPTQVASGITVDDSNNITINGDLLTLANVGTVGNGTTVTAVESGDADVHLTTLTIDEFTLPAVAAAGSQGNGALLYTLPAGAQIVEHCRFNVGVFASNGQAAADTPDVGIGSVIATGAITVLSSTATFEDIMTGQTLTANGTVGTAISAGSDFTTDTGGSKAIYLNYADSWANGTNLHANGTVVIPWVHLQ